MRKLAEYSDGILMILAGVTFAVVLMLVPNAGASAHDADALARRDFDSLVRSIADRYQIHGRSVPMMWVANLFARSVTKDGVHGMKVVEFEGVPKWGESERAGLGDLVKEKLSKRWSPMVRQHEADGADSFVYVQGDADGKHTRMIVVDLDDGETSRELDMVSITLNPEQLAKWVKEQDAKDEKKRSAVGSLGIE